MKLKNLLQKQNQFLIKKDFLMLSIVDVINKEFKINLKKENCLTKNGVLYIKTKPLYKEKIIHQKQNLLVKLKDFGVFDIV
ncbi:MAG: hypothetical protein ACR2IQ_00510 [Minisyncoccia bacterium]